MRHLYALLHSGHVIRYVLSLLTLLPIPSLLLKAGNPGYPPGGRDLPAIGSVILVNADTDQDILTLADGVVVSLASLGTRNLNIRVNTLPAQVGSVVMQLSGSFDRTKAEGTPPYTLFGNSGADYKPWSAVAGSFTFTATPYTLSGGGGTAGIPASISFSIVEQAPGNMPPKVSAGSGLVVAPAAGSAQLNGAASDADGSISAYLWSQVSGPSAAAFSSATVAAPTVSKLVEGLYVFRLAVTDNVGASSSDEVEVMVTNTAGGRFNGGGGQLVTSMGTFGADAHFVPSPGTVYTRSVAIAGTTDDALYQSERNGADFSYGIPLTNGRYTVVLHFAEIYFTAAGKRVFDVYAEKLRMLDNYDIFRKVGANTATSESFIVDVADGLLNLRFSALAADGGINRAKISGIELIPVAPPGGDGKLSGSLQKWQTHTIDFAGPTSSQTANTPNPYLYYRMQVLFTHVASGRKFNVPGFFDGDGNGGGSGNVWRVRFNPDAEGAWTYKASFRKGTDIAISLDPAAGTADSFDGATGGFTIGGARSGAGGFLEKGRLVHKGSHYLETQDGKPWIKGGINSPETFLALPYTDHVQDWTTGDPDWAGGKGKGIIGSLNYLSKMQVNSIYFLPMNIGGDGNGNTHPFVGSLVGSGSTSNDNLHYDILKLGRWEQVFEHAQRKGLMLHFVLNEAEEPNKRELDNATLGRERKLFYRELVARFGHHNAIQWNMCEEYNYKLVLSVSTIQAWAQYLGDVDPYDHPIAVHNYGNAGAIKPFMGDKRFGSTSFQYASGTGSRGLQVEEWRRLSADAGHPLPINMDEMRSTTTTNMALQRKELLWPTLLSGGGIEWYVSSADQSLQNFRTFEPLYRWTGYALGFMQSLPVKEMVPADNLATLSSNSLGGAQVFARANRVYAVFLPNASGTATLNLTGVSGNFSLRWFNPRSGIFEGATRTVSGGGSINLGAPPANAAEDWVVLLTAQTTSGIEASGGARSAIGLEAQPDVAAGLEIQAAPNPSAQQFILTIQSRFDSPMELQVMDGQGKMVERFRGLNKGQTLSVGQSYLPGVYVAHLIQGGRRQTIRLVKMAR